MSNNIQTSAKNNPAKKNRNERAHQLKIYSIGSVVILAVIILLTNILIDVFLGKKLTSDFSLEGSNTISQETQKYLDALPQDAKIRIIGLFEMPETIIGTQYQYIVPILKDYEKKSNGKISVEYIDIQKNPALINELDPNGVFDLAKQSGKYAVSYNGKTDIVDPLYCYTMNTEYLEKYNKYVATGNNTEFTFTNSIMSLVNGYASKAYIITGLKENGSVQLKRILNAMSFETAEISAAVGFKVPEDCDLLILNGPNTDITETMYIEIKAYIEKGGKVIAAVDYALENANQPFDNLNRLLNDFNINVEHCMVSENDPDYQLNTQINDSRADVTAPYADYTSEQKMHITLARPMGLTIAKNENVITDAVLVTSSSATKSVADSNYQEKQLGEDTGSFAVAMHSVFNNDSKGEIYAFGTVNFTSDVYYSEFTVNDKNADFLKACIRNMIPTSNQYKIDIPVKDIENYQLDMNKATTSSSTAVLIVFMIVLPVIFCSMAVIVYNKRKNL